MKVAQQINHGITTLTQQPTTLEGPKSKEARVTSFKKTLAKAFFYVAMASAAIAAIQLFFLTAGGWLAGVLPHALVVIRNVCRAVDAVSILAGLAQPLFPALLAFRLWRDR